MDTKSALIYTMISSKNPRVSPRITFRDFAVNSSIKFSGYYSRTAFLFLLLRTAKIPSRILPHVGSTKSLVGFYPANIRFFSNSWESFPRDVFRNFLTKTWIAPWKSSRIFPLNRWITNSMLGILHKILRNFSINLSRNFSWCFYRNMFYR